MIRFYRGTRGSVSVYMIIILVPVFLFQALFLDLIRVRLAGRESEMALKAGLRSVMSAYGPSLQDYGLYGLVWDEEKGLSVFQEVLERNLNTANPAPFRYTDTRPEPALNRLKPVYTLANPTVLKRQITQEMKVKAPVEFMTELVDRFRKTGASTAFAAGADYYKKIEKLEKLHWEREDALEQAWADAQNLIAVSLSGVESSGNDLEKLQELAARIGLHSVEEIRSSLSEVEAGLVTVSARAEEIRQSINSAQMSLAAMAQFAKENMAGIQAIQNQIGIMASNLNTVQSEANALISKKNELEQLLKDMAEYTALFASSKVSVKMKEDAAGDAHRRLVTSLDEAERADEAWRGEAEELRSSAIDGNAVPAEWFQTEAVYTQQFFSEYRTGAAKIPAAFQGLSAEWGDVEWWHSAKWDTLLVKAAGLQSQIETFESERKSEESKRAQRNSALKREENAQRGAIKSALSEMRQAAGSCGLGEDPYREQYRELEGQDGLADKYKAYHKQAGEELLHDTSVPEDVDRASGRSLDMLKQFSGLLAGFRDELFVNEYVLDKLNYRTSGLTSGEAGRTESRSQPETHPLRSQEAEYVLYGFDSCAANQGAAYGEMFLVLFGIRTVEALMEPKTQAMQAAGTPFLAFLIAAAQGAGQALMDARTLSEGGSVSLFKKINGFEVHYRDFLRIFLLMHPNQSSVIARLQALLEMNTGVDLTAATTYIQGSGATSVKLWFLPGIMKMLHRTAGVGCEVVQGRCQIRRTAVYAYD